MKAVFFSKLGLASIAATLLAFASPALAKSAQCHALFKTSIKTPQERFDEAQTFTVEMSPGRRVFAQIVAPSSPDQPVFLIMPGANRNLLLNEPGQLALINKGFGVAVMSFSVQPFSVTALGEGVRPEFRTKQLTLKDFAAETEKVARSIQAAGYKNVVPVSLSYSGSVSPYLQGFPLVIETAPMTSQAAASPQAAQYHSMLRAGELFNPFFGPAITRNLLDTSYRMNWKAQAQKMVDEFKLPADRVDDFVEGYTALSRASEDATWENIPLPSQTKRVFILAGLEEPGLFKDEVQTFKRLYKDRKDLQLFITLNASHIIGHSQPAMFAQLLEMATSQTSTFTGGVAFVNPATGEFRQVVGSQALEVLDTLISTGPGAVPSKF
jgi:hypothetical protein